jgi:NhaP-type Na+/H+ or K+/H+ antiporter
MNLAAQFSFSKLEIARLLRVKFYIRVLTLLALLFVARALANRSSGFSTGPSLCMFRNVTGLPCPLCGTTRSVGNILIGNFNVALQINPLGYFSLAFLILLFVSPATIKRSSAYVAKKWWSITQMSQILTIIGLLSVAWILNALRLF